LERWGTSELTYRRLTAITEKNIYLRYPCQDKSAIARAYKMALREGTKGEGTWQAGEAMVVLLLPDRAFVSPGKTRGQESAVLSVSGIPCFPDLLMTQRVGG
jgi:hypothetical protein